MLFHKEQDGLQRKASIFDLIVAAETDLRNRESHAGIFKKALTNGKILPID